MAIPNRVRERVAQNLKGLLPILQQQRARDVSEADTVTLVKDMLADVFGYDKYSELTSEYCIRGKYCDLAVKLNEKPAQLIEVKSIGSTLEDRHVQQAVDYASNEGVEWVLLTNAITWRLYQVIFAKPIDKRLLAEVDVTAVDLRKDDTFEALYLLTKEGFIKGAHIELRDRQDATSRFTIAALLLENDNVRQAIRRELRRVVDVLVDEADIIKVLRDEVIKRDVVEGPEAESAARRVNRTEVRALRARKETEPAPVAATPSPPSEAAPAKTPGE
jgi:predicted type IV restriction endonuclease